MYDDHYGLTGRPFQLTPDPAFWYETATHRKAMAYLGYGLAQGEGFIVITGDIGAGKTTLIGHLKDTLDTRALNAITLVSTQIEAEDLLRIVATELGVNPARLAKAELLTAIERGLHAVARTGRRTLLIVDEAQALPVSALEELRMLSNFQAGGHALLQIVLLGQPEFRDRIQGSDRLEQLRQRVIAIHHLDPMAEDEVADYIAHRLSVVGWTGRPDFAEDAFAALYAGSGGVPRRLNLLAGRVMLYASIEGLELIDGATVETVLGDLHADLPMLHAPVVPDAVPMAIVPDAPQPVESPIRVVPAFVRADPVEATSSPSVEEEAPVEPMAIVPDIARPVPEASAVKVTVAETVAATEPAEAPSPVEDEPRRSFVPRTSHWIDIEPAVDEPVVEPVPVLVARIAELESRVEQQEVALRRVLTLLVDWVEGDSAKPDEAPVKRTASWHDAA